MMTLLWILDKQFDVSLDKVSWEETIKYLQRDFFVVLATTYKKKRVQPKSFRSPIIYYYKSKNLPVINCLSLYYTHLRIFERLVYIHKPDILLLNTNNFLLIKKAIYLNKRYNIYLFLDVRSLPVNQWQIQNKVLDWMLAATLKIASKHFNGITYITQEIREYCINSYGLSDHNNVIWESGVNTEIFMPTTNDKSNRKFRIIYHGSISKNRGILNVIKSLSQLEFHDIEFFILGSGNAIDEIRRISKECGIADKVIIIPSVPYEQVPKYINKCDVGILPFPNWPGWNTSSPIKLFEYLACGKPVIATEIPAHINVLRNRDFVFWSKDATPEELRKSIIRAYKSRNSLRKLGYSARQYAEEHFSWKAQAEKLAIFLRSCSR